MDSKADELLMLKPARCVVQKWTTKIAIVCTLALLVGSINLYPRISPVDTSERSKSHQSKDVGKFTV